MSNKPLAVSDDINQILPFYQKLATGNVAEVLPKIQALAHAGNMYANYVLGIYLIFGRVPRHYNFNKIYPVGYVKENSLSTLNEQLGLKHLIQLLKMGENVEQYHLKGLYDLYCIIDGQQNFFINNDIECRPKNGSYPQLDKLFSSKDRVRDVLVKLDHYEVYIDYAKHKLEQFSHNNNKEDFETALDHLNKVVEKAEFNQFNLFDISEAHFLLGKIYLSGNPHCKRDVKSAIKHIDAARLDKGFVVLLNFYKSFGDQYIKSIRKCIGMITDLELQEKLIIENGFTVPERIDTSAILKKLQSTPVIENLTPVISIQGNTESGTEDDIAAMQQEQEVAQDVLRKEQAIAEDFDRSLLDDDIADVDSDSDDLMYDQVDHTEQQPDFMEDHPFDEPDLADDDYPEPDF